MENPLQGHTVTLKRSEDYSGKKPTVSLILLADLSSERNELVLDSVAPHVDEVVVITASTPKCLSEASAIAKLLSSCASTGKLGAHVEVNAANHPELYMPDVRDTYNVSNPLCGESFEGPFTGESLITDWGKIRNLGWRLGSQEWKLFLESCDELRDPSYIASVCEVLGGYRSDLGYSLYASRDGSMSVKSSRIAKNSSCIEWVGKISPSLEGTTQIAFLDGSLITTKHRRRYQADNELNAFKVLYARARWCNWQMPPGDLLHLARLSKRANMTQGSEPQGSATQGSATRGSATRGSATQSFAEAAISTYLDVSLYTEERAWACALQGELLENKGNYEGASAWYERSIAEHPGYKSAYRLCRSRFNQQQWQSCLDAFQVGLGNDEFAHIVDDGNESKEKSLILVVAALQQLGRTEEAKENGKTLRALYPNNSAILKLCEGL
jgi:tetratricopeptide (TPR) repeat protein